MKRQMKYVFLIVIFAFMITSCAAKYAANCILQKNYTIYNNIFDKKSCLNGIQGCVEMDTKNKLLNIYGGCIPPAAVIEIPFKDSNEYYKLSMKTYSNRITKLVITMYWWDGKSTNHKGVNHKNLKLIERINDLKQKEKRILKYGVPYPNVVFHTIIKVSNRWSDFETIKYLKKPIGNKLYIQFDTGGYTGGSIKVKEIMITSLAGNVINNTK